LSFNTARGGIFRVHQILNREPAVKIVSWRSYHDIFLVPREYFDGAYSDCLLPRHNKL